MRPLIDGIRLLDQKTATNNDQELIPESLNVKARKHGRNTWTIARSRFLKSFRNWDLSTRKSAEVYLFERWWILQDKQKQNRVKDFIEVDDLMDQRQKRRIKDYTVKLKVWKSMWRTGPEMKSWISKWQNIFQGKRIAWRTERSNQLCQIIWVKLLEVKWARNKKENI